MTPPAAFLLDLDGTLYTGAGPVPGAPEALRALRAARVPFRCVTNTSTRPRAAVVERARGFGLDLRGEDVFTAVLAGAAEVRAAGHRTVAAYLAPDALVDLGEFELVGGTSGRAAAGPPDAVVVGDLGVRWTYDLMLEAFRFLQAGAGFIALSRDRYFQRGDGLALDAGPFVAGLEYATGREARVAGKPNAGFFLGAVSALGMPAAQVAMVGDDLWTDVEGAQRAGLAGWLVRTGKFREEALAGAGVRPDRILESVADLTGLVT